MLLMVWRTNHAFGQLSHLLWCTGLCVCVCAYAWAEVKYISIFATLCYYLHVCSHAGSFVVLLFEPELDRQQCLITALFRNHGLHSCCMLHTCSITHRQTHILTSHTFPAFFFFLLKYSFLFLPLSLSYRHTLTHSVPPYSPAPHSWARGSSSDIWASQPAALLNSNCQAEQKHPPPPSSNQWHTFPFFSLLPPPALPHGFCPPTPSCLHPTVLLNAKAIICLMMWQSCWFLNWNVTTCSFIIVWLLQSSSKMIRFLLCPWQQLSRMFKSIRDTISISNRMKFFAEWYTLMLTIDYW